MGFGCLLRLLSVMTSRRASVVYTGRINIDYHLDCLQKAERLEGYCEKYCSSLCGVTCTASPERILIGNFSWNIVRRKRFSQD